MKKLFIAMLVLTFVLGTAAIAMAGIGGGGYTGQPSANPHGGYGAATNLCRVCHAVHKAGEAGNPDVGRTADSAATWKLTRIADGATPSVFAACYFCHDQSGITAKKVYDNPGGTAEHRNGPAANVIPDGTDQTKLNRGNSGELDCMDCHTQAPHGRAVQNAKMLAGADVEATCKFCHDKNNISVADLGQAAFDKTSHPLAAIGDRVGRAQAVAYGGGTAALCTYCHTDSNGTGDFPHTTTGGVRFLGSGRNGTVTVGALDDKCMVCHVNAPQDAGVGITW